MKVKQSIPVAKRFTIQQFNALFPTDDACLVWLMSQRYPDGIAFCDKCLTERKHHRIAARRAWSCDYCGKMISPTAGSIFAKSPTPLRLWFYAMYLMGQTRCGISAKQIQRETGVTYKTAWRMFKQIRTLMSEDIRLEGSSVEADETYYGAALKNKHRSKLKQGTHKDKQPIFGMVERGGRVVTCVVPNAKETTLLPIIAERVLPASTIFTDCYTPYDNLHKMPQGYNHQRINHGAKVYVMGDIHTQSIEGFWSLLKRGIGGVYHSVSAKYLQSYCDEYSYRYNRRFDDQPMFTSLLVDAVAKAE